MAPMLAAHGSADYIFQRQSVGVRARTGGAQVGLRGPGAGRREEIARGQTHGEAEKQAQAAHPDPVDAGVAGLHESRESIAYQREEDADANSLDFVRRVFPESLVITADQEIPPEFRY